MGMSYTIGKLFKSPFQWLYYFYLASFTCFTVSSKTKWLCICYIFPLYGHVIYHWKAPQVTFPVTILFLSCKLYMFYSIFQNKMIVYTYRLVQQYRNIHMTFCTQTHSAENCCINHHVVVGNQAGDILKKDNRGCYGHQWCYLAFYVAPYTIDH